MFRSFPISYIDEFLFHDIVQRIMSFSFGMASIKEKEEIGGFPVASPEVLCGRVIRKAKRQSKLVNLRVGPPAANK